MFSWTACKASAKVAILPITAKLMLKNKGEAE